MLSWIIHIPIYILAIWGVFCIFMMLENEDEIADDYELPQWYDY